MSDLARFLAKVKVMESGCHDWQSTLHRDGYGKFWFDSKQVSAHRVSYLLQKGPITEGLHVLHRCDNRKCVNPEHLYLGTNRQNIQDKIDRCAWWGNMTYSFETIKKAKAMYATGMTQQAIADSLGMHQTQVSRYVRGEQRKDK